MDVLVKVEGRQDEDPGLSVGGHDLLGGAQAVEDGHSDVHEDDVGGQLIDEGDGFGAGVGLPDDGHVGLGVEDQTESGTNHLLVIGQEESDRVGHGMVLRGSD